MIVFKVDILQPDQSCSKMYGKQPRYLEILVISNTIQKPERVMHPGIMKKCQQVKDEYETDQQG